MVRWPSRSTLQIFGHGVSSGNDFPSVDRDRRRPGAMPRDMKRGEGPGARVSRPGARRTGSDRCAARSGPAPGRTPRLSRSRKRFWNSWLLQALGQFVDGGHQLGFARQRGHALLPASRVGGGGLAETHAGAIGGQVGEREPGAAARIEHLLENTDHIGRPAVRFEREHRRNQPVLRQVGPGVQGHDTQRAALRRCAQHAPDQVGTPDRIDRQRQHRGAVFGPGIMAFGRAGRGHRHHLAHHRHHRLGHRRAHRTQGAGVAKIAGDALALVGGQQQVASARFEAPGQIGPGDETEAHRHAVRSTSRWWWHRARGSWRTAPPGRPAVR
jgi:hypothetical protein